ncbi:MAG: ATP-binding cassette domain-containing protein [Candidatus Polarisedimenticolia bacterium]
MNRRLVLDLTVPLHRFDLRVAWETDEPALGVFGPSGAGKTTLLLAIAGLRRDARGRVHAGGADWLDSGRGIDRPPEARGVGYVPQDGLLFPHRTVLGNVLAGGRRASSRGRPGIDPERVLEILELGALRDRGVGELSGGERQRVALGRALCSGPELLLLDEPLAGLDLPLRRRILNDLLAIRDTFGLPTLLVTHDPTEARVLSREVCVLAAGRVVARGSPQELFARPEVLPLARSAGADNLLEGVIVERRDGSAVVELRPGLRIVVPADGLDVGTRLSVGVRAEDLILAIGAPSGLSARNRIAGRVREVRETPPGRPQDGDRAGTGEVLVLVDAGSLPAPLVVSITAEAQRQLGVRPGIEVLLLFKAGACRVLAARRGPWAGSGDPPSKGDG